jgi:hypothetical protein
MSKGEVIFFCGKMGAGKSTKSIEITQDRNAVLLSEDEWLESLYPNKVRSLDDYVKYSNLIKPQRGCLVTSEFIRDNFPGHGCLPFKQLSEEPQRCSFISAALHQNIDDVSILVDRPPKILAFTTH